MFMGDFNKQLLEMDPDSFEEIYSYIFVAIRQKFFTLTLFDVPENFVDILNMMFSSSEKLKDIFLKQRSAQMAWIPGPNCINLEKGIGSCTGDMLEYNSVLGPFF